MQQRAAFSSIDDLVRMRGERVGESGWFTVSQDMIDGFAALTRDPQWIHVDVERARRESPLGTTIAHGFLTLSLLSMMIEQCVRFENVRASYNYGFDRVRFVSPVPAGADVRGGFTIHHVRPVEGGAQVTWMVEITVRGAPKPAVVAEWITRTLFV